MKRKCLLLLTSAVWLAYCPSLCAQDAAAQAAALAERRDFEESYRALVGKIEDLQGIISLQRSELSSLRNEVAGLREAVQTERSERARAAINYATRDDLRKVVDKLQEEMERKRAADKELILKEIRRVAEIAATPVHVPEPRVVPEVKPEPHENYYSHKVKEGQTLSAIIEGFNARLKAEGKPGRITLEEVKKANPNMDPNRVVVGREIRIPVPSGK